MGRAYFRRGVQRGDHRRLRCLHGRECDAESDGEVVRDMKKIALAIVIASGMAIPAEGIFTTAYKDPVGIDTICVGSTAGVKPGDRKSMQECMALLSKEMGDAVRAVDTCQPGLPVGVLAAFSDAAFNIGEYVACDPRRSTAAKLLLAKDYLGACKQLLRWDKAWVLGAFRPLPGLTKRRARNVEVCMKGLT